MADLPFSQRWLIGDESKSLLPGHVRGSNHCDDPWAGAGGSTVERADAGMVMGGAYHHATDDIVRGNVGSISFKAADLGTCILANLRFSDDRKS